MVGDVVEQGAEAAVLGDEEAVDAREGQPEHEEEEEEEGGDAQVRGRLEDVVELDEVRVRRNELEEADLASCMSAVLHVARRRVSECSSGRGEREGGEDGPCGRRERARPS